MLRIVWNLSPFILLVGGIVLGAVVLVWAKNIGIFFYVIPKDVPFWLPGKQVGFALAWHWSFGLMFMPVTAALAIAVV